MSIRSPAEITQRKAAISIQLISRVTMASMVGVRTLKHTLGNKKRAERRRRRDVSANRRGRGNRRKKRDRRRRSVDKLKNVAKKSWRESARSAKSKKRNVKDKKGRKNARDKREKKSGKERLEKSYKRKRRGRKEKIREGETTLEIDVTPEIEKTLATVAGMKVVGIPRRESDLKDKAGRSLNLAIKTTMKVI